MTNVVFFIDLIFPDYFYSWGFLFKVYFTINIGTFTTFTTNKCKHII